ncbi:MAG: hypothetical protein LBQ77_08095 [Treponema sp.]|nr:hypothetical protein [Treponema sp.]
MGTDLPIVMNSSNSTCGLSLYGKAFFDYWGQTSPYTVPLDRTSSKTYTLKVTEAGCTVNYAQSL